MIFFIEMSKIVIIEYGAGNLFSVRVAIERLGYEVVCSADPRVVREADKVIFPGVGQAAAAMRQLRESGMDRVIPELKVPVLGICLGMQLMCRHSEEGDVDCLGIFDVGVKRFVSLKHEDKVPHMGWNTISQTDSKLFRGLTKEEFVYFVHSFYVPVNDCTAAVTDYILPFSAALHKDNYYATQFHPEKSGSVGERILQNFLDL